MQLQFFSTFTFQLLTREVVFGDDETGILQFRPTIPMTCHSAQVCEITVKAVISGVKIHGPCAGIVIEGRRCGIKMQSKNSLNTIYDMKLKKAENGRYQTKDDFYEIFLEVDSGFENKIWMNYKLPKIPVSIMVVLLLFQPEGSMPESFKCKLNQII